MNKSLAAIAATAILALGACSSGESEPTKTVTKTAAVEADTSAAPAKDDTAVQAEKEAESGDDLWTNLDTYADAYSLGQAVGADYWATGDAAFECKKSEQTTLQQRDELTGKVADVTYMDCERKGTGELIGITVNGNYTDSGPQVPMCDVYLEACFGGPGWTVDAENEFALVEVLKALDVDTDAWGFGE